MKIQEKEAETGIKKRYFFTRYRLSFLFALQFKIQHSKLRIVF